MSANLDYALKAIQDIVGKVEGIRAAPEYATDKIPAGTWAMAFPISGTYTQKPQGVLKGLHQAGLYVYTPRVDLPKTLKVMIPMIDKVAAALESEPTLLDTVETFGDIDYIFDMNLNVGTTTAPAIVVGITFTIMDIKIQDSTVIT